MILFGRGQACCLHVTRAGCRRCFCHVPVSTNPINDSIRSNQPASPRANDWRRHVSMNTMRKMVHQTTCNYLHHSGSELARSGMQHCHGTVTGTGPGPLPATRARLFWRRHSAGNEICVSFLCAHHLPLTWTIAGSPLGARGAPVTEQARATPPHKKLRLATMFTRKT